MILWKKNKIAVYTAIFGERDRLLEPEHKIRNADLYCFTDNPKNKARQFKTIIREPSHDDPNRSAKKYKVLGDKMLEKYDYTIWIDGNHKIKFDDANELVQEYLIRTKGYLALMGHPDGRNCIYQEYEFIKSINVNNQIDSQELIDKQIQRYSKEGLPKNNGLIAGGFIIRDNKSSNTKEIMLAWWDEINKGSRRDQLSFNYVIWKLNESHIVIPGIYWDNTYIKVLSHKQ